jgi:hypothetical protein
VPDVPIEKVVEAVVKYGFERLTTDSALAGAVAFWKTADDPLQMDHKTRVLNQLNNLLHKGVLGEPVHAITEPAGPSFDVLGDIAAKASLPTDGAYLWARRGMYVMGIVSGVASGQSFMAIASVKSLILSELERAVVSAVTDAITEPLKRCAVEPPDEPRRPPDIVELTELARDFQQIQGSSVAFSVRKRQTLHYEDLERWSSKKVERSTSVFEQAKHGVQIQPVTHVKRITK